MKIFIIFILLGSNVFAKKMNSITLPIYKSSKTFELKFPRTRKVLINFWATWCTSCIQEIPILEALKKKNPSVDFIAINAGDSAKKINKFIKRYGFNYKMLMDKDKSISKSLGILSLPQTLVIDKDGTILFHKNTPPKKL